MSKLFVYYSLSGNGDAVANHYKEKGYEIFKLETKKPMPKSFPILIMKGGFLAGIKAKTKIIDPKVKFDEYDEIIVGSPIWNGNLASPVNTLLTLIDGKKVDFVLYSGSGEGKGALKRLNKEYPDSNILFLKSPKDNLNEIEKLK